MRLLHHRNRRAYKFVRFPVSISGATQASRRIRPEDLERLRDHDLEHFDPDKLWSLDDDFHRLLFEAARRPRTVSMMQNFSIHFDRVRNMSLFSIKDELAIQNLRRTDAIGWKLMAAAVTVIAFACAVTALDGRMAGYALVGTIWVLAVMRFVIFCVMDSKGV